MEQYPLLSIIMPVYNAEKRIRISVDSILNQSYKNIELILVDDGSKDSSSNICDTYAKEDARVVVFHQPNRGVSAARNCGIMEAKGEYITFVDSDDTVDADAYAAVMNFLKNNGTDTDMLIFGMSFDYYRGNTPSHKKKLSVEKNLILPVKHIAEHFFYLYETNYLSSACNKVIRASVIRENAILFNEEMAILEDFKFVLDILEKSNEIIAIKDVFYRYYNDMDESSLKRRPMIDYKHNFSILDIKLKEFALFANLTDEFSVGRINGMIIRYYLLAIEKVFGSTSRPQNKYKELHKYVYDAQVKEAIDNAVCTGKRLQVIHWLMKKRLTLLLYLAFSLNEVISTLRRYPLSV